MAPSSGCGILFASVFFAGPTQVTGFRVFRNNAALTISVSVHIDGTLVGSGTFTGISGGGWGDFPISGGTTFAGGARQVRVSYVVTSGATWQNLFLDAVDFTVPCTNVPPSLPAVAHDGMPGNFGWTQHGYGFSTSTTDPEGDPVSFSWSFGDGTLRFGPSVSHAYGAIGARNIVVTATDDPSARCPGAPARSSSTIVRFTAIDDSLARLQRPAAGRSCIEDREVTVPTMVLMAGRCRVVSDFVSTGAPVARASFYVDDVEFDSDTARAYEGAYHSLEHSVGSHALGACFEMTGDKYLRLSCAQPHTYFNVGAP